MKHGTRRLPIAVALVACLTTSAFARIGETEAQADTRYGAPVSIGEDDADFPQRIYRKEGIEIAASFSHGKIVHLVFRKLDNAPFTEAEFKVLARAEGITVAEVTTFPPNDRTWIVQGQTGWPQAIYDTQNKKILVMTKDYVFAAASVHEKKQRAEAEKRLSGF